MYPEYSEKSDIVNSGSSTIKQKIRNLWDKVPAFRNAMTDVPTLHVPNKKVLIKKALNDPDFMIISKAKPIAYFYPS